MADDTRQPREDLSREALNIHPENKPFSGAQWQDRKQNTYKPLENANLLAGGTENTAGGKIPEATLENVFKDGIGLSDFTQLPTRPCVRDALLTGIGAGFGMGSLRAIFRAPVWTACSWAVGSFCLGAPIMYQYCNYRRHAEKEGMMRAVEILNRKEVEKRAREAQRERAREQRRAEKEKDQDAQFAALREANGKGGGKPWWKVW